MVKKVFEPTESPEEIAARVRDLLKKDEPVYPPLKADATDMEFLQWLQHDLWLKQRGYDRFRPGGYDFYVERRGITSEELSRAKEAITHLGLIVEPINACMVFNFGLHVYEPDLEPDEEEFAQSHGIKLKVHAILTITGRHTDTRFDETWKLLSPLSHNPVNEARLQKYGFAAPREASYYDY
jgi:hypothetical protein